MKAKVLKAIKINNSQHKITKKCQKSNWKCCIYVNWISEFHIVNSLISQNGFNTKKAAKGHYHFMICDTFNVYRLSLKSYFFHENPTIPTAARNVENCTNEKVYNLEKLHFWSFLMQVLTHLMLVFLNFLPKLWKYRVFTWFKGKQTFRF